MRRRISRVVIGAALAFGTAVSACGSNPNAAPPAPATGASASTSTPAPGAGIPALPAPVPVTLDARTSAYLLLHFTSTICSPRPNCVATLPQAAAILRKARAAHALVAYSETLTPGTEIRPEVAPAPGDPVVAAPADKFFQTRLDDILKQHGVKTVVISGVASNGAVLYTAFEANIRGYTAVVAEDAISAPDPFATVVARYQLLNQPGYANPQNQPLADRKVTLSRSDLIAFR